MNLIERLKALEPSLITKLKYGIGQGNTESGFRGAEVAQPSQERGMGFGQAEANQQNTRPL